MHNRFPIAVIGVFFLMIMSCTQSAETTLPPDEVLVDIMYDLHLAETALARVNLASQDSVAAIVRDRIAMSYDISPETMDAWMEALQRSPDHLMMVYDSVIARFERQNPDK